jgi:protein-tyrosine-phosphatase
LVMGNRHRSVIGSQWPEHLKKVHLMATDGGEISDPFGGSLELYQQCARDLDRYTSQWVEQLDASSVIRWESGL